MIAHVFAYLLLLNLLLMSVTNYLTNGLKSPADDVCRPLEIALSNTFHDKEKENPCLKTVI